MHDGWSFPIVSWLGFKYLISFIDDHTSYTWLSLMKQKSELFIHLKTFYAMNETHFNAKDKIFHSGSGVNICQNKCLKFLKEKDVIFQRSCLDTPQNVILSIKIDIC